MNRCKWCSASGWFHALTDNGLCNDCNLTIVNRVQIHAGIIRRTLTQIRQTQSLDVKMRLARRIEREARSLKEFEDKDIRTITPRPGTLVDLYSAYRGNLRSMRDTDRRSQEELPDLEGPDFSQVTVVETMDPLDAWDEKVVA